MASKRPHYLVQRGGVYYFRRALPLNLQSRFDRAEIKVSLLTGDSRTAEMRSRELTNRFVQLTSLVKRMPELTPEVITRIVRDSFARGLENIREMTVDVNADGNIDTAFERSETKAALKLLQQRIASRDYERATAIEARELLDEANVPIPGKASEEWDALCHGLTRAKAESFRIYAAMLEGRYDDVEPKDPMFKGPANAVLGQAASTSGPAVAQLSDQFIELKSKSDWVKKTRMDNIRVLKWFREMVGEKRTITSVGKSDLHDFRDLLMTLPKNYAKAKKFEGLSLVEITKAGANDEKLSLKTANKYLSMLKGFLHWCVDEEHIAVAPGLKIKVPLKFNPLDARHPFTPDQLSMLFSSPLYKGCKSAARRTVQGDVVCKDGKFWIPLIGLYTGMRLGEIVQLRTTDVKDENGLHYFDIAIYEDEEEKTLKTMSSKRRVPLHTELIKIGFLNFYQDCVAKLDHSPRLFPEIKPGKDGYFSHNFSKAFWYYTTKIGVKTQKTAFHSFRHNFKDALQAAGIDSQVQHALMGHTDKSMDGTYGSPEGMPIAVLTQAMNKLTAPVKLEHLHSE